MTLPLLGPMSLSGFAHIWYLLFLLVILGVIGLYIAIQLARKRRVLRFANMELLESVAPQRSNRWRHLPAILLVAAMLLVTIAMAGPTRDVRIPRNRAVVMLVIDVSQSMRATDVPPNRMAAAQDAAKQFTDELTPGINLGLIAYAGTASVLVSPTTNRAAMKAAIDKLQAADRTATGEGIFTALQAIATVGAVIGGGDGPPPARIVLFSDGKETVPSNPDSPKGAYTAARTAKDQGVPISTISFGTPYGYVEINDGWSASSSPPLPSSSPPLPSPAPRLSSSSPWGWSASSSPPLLSSSSSLPYRCSSSCATELEASIPGLARWSLPLPQFELIGRRACVPRLRVPSRWTAAGMLNAERSFRRIKGHKQMPQLVAALKRRAHPDTEPVGTAA